MGMEADYNWDQRQQLIDMVIGGVSPPYGGNDYTRFTGNQWNEDWEWNREKLEHLSTEQLKKLYKGETMTKEIVILTPQSVAEKMWKKIQVRMAELSVYLEAHPEVEMGFSEEDNETDKPDG